MGYLALRMSDMPVKMRRKNKRQRKESRKTILGAACDHYGKCCISFQEFHDFAYGHGPDKLTLEIMKYSKKLPVQRLC